MRKRVVVTGTGVVTSLATEVNEFWDSICASKSGIGPIERFDTSEFKINFGGEVKNFNPTEHMSIPAKEVRRLDRFVQFGMVAANQAVTQSGLDFTKGDACRYGVLVGSGVGGLQEIETQHNTLYDRGPRKLSPFMIPKMMVNACSGNISVHWGLKGPNSAVATACASANNAIGDAFRLIQFGMADTMVTGGAEAAVTAMGLGGFARMNALSNRVDNPQAASRPFDSGRDGFVLSEGAGIVILEEYEFAKNRGANILAEIVGYGMSADASHMTAPDPLGRGAAHAMTMALRDADLAPEDIDYINAHGTSTPLGDKAETNAVKSVYGEYARNGLAVSSTKSQVGHLLGASGGVEFVVSTFALQNQVAPPTINLDDPDPDCDLDYIPHEARQMKIDCIMSNSFGFGGHNASLVLKRI
ncbi:3-oxoacyl-[acyl-carrier-protein] synthase 2 [Polystyrenella longa]|uniref:3-oxoacyl-[acyl-carrier-protein] synthase 2 n=1 Tax=Polystyrenella longa TaxID=2528007 RepID=A0A518CLQ6_9PLAN|nr:beta-ketoacyl-ACP synthase II [Polystyrenella longa]QDU80161.1 3-oxoacyl-[acyl-carrier-protein] synthase 2 [Polystyrenella longa]